MKVLALTRHLPLQYTLAICIAFLSTAEAQNLRTVDYPGASSTFLTAINTQGDVTGYYLDSSGFPHGFYTKAHKFHGVEVAISMGNTYPWGIDDNYNVVGYYFYGRGFTAGFRAGPNNSRQIYEAFNAETSPVYNITPTTGIVSGTYSEGSQAGFYYANGTYTSITDQGPTAITGENDSGQFVGSYYVGLNSNGFLYDGVSMFTDIDYPAAISTTPNRISNTGEIVGSYQLADKINHGFTYISGTFVSVDFPGATDTQIFGINASGTIVGRYTDSSGIVHGFEGKP